MTLKIIKDGKENNQGVGYLDDGTMIVVENGRRYMGKTIRVVVTSVLQTSAGRMIFARPLGSKKPSREMIPENVLLETGESAPVALLAQEEETERLE